MGKIITNLTKQSLAERLAKKPEAIKDWKRINDAALVPDRGFVKQLKKLDASFEVIWDCVSCNWEIWSLPPIGEPYLVMTVGVRGKSYEELSAAVLLKLKENIYFANNFTPKQICDYLDELDTQVQRRKGQELKNKIQSMALDTFDYARGVVKIQVPRSLKLKRVVQNA